MSWNGEHAGISDKRAYYLCSESVFSSSFFSTPFELPAVTFLCFFARSIFSRKPMQVEKYPTKFLTFVGDAPKTGKM